MAFAIKLQTYTVPGNVHKASFSPQCHSLQKLAQGMGTLWFQTSQRPLHHTNLYSRENARK